MRAVRSRFEQIEFLQQRARRTLWLGVKLLLIVATLVLSLDCFCFACDTSDTSEQQSAAAVPLPTDLEIQRLKADYVKAREHSIFGDQIAFTAIERTSKAFREPTSHLFKYVHKLPCRKVLITLPETPDEEGIGHGIAAVLNESSLETSERPYGEKNYRPTSISVISDASELKTNAMFFGSVKPVFSPYNLDDTDIQEIIQSEKTTITRLEESSEGGRNFIQIGWSEELHDPAGSGYRTGTMKLDKDNHWVLVSADFTAGLAGKPPIAAESMLIEYGCFGDKRLPTNVRIKYTSPDGDGLGRDSWTQVEFSEIVYDLSEVSDSEFDHSKEP